MIVEVTLNPALEKTVCIDTLKPGSLNRIRSVTVDAGGKGVNVAKMAKVLGVECVATGFCGGDGGTELINRLTKLDIKHDFVMVDCNTRTNTKVLDEKYGITELNEAGVSVSQEEEQCLLDKLLSYLAVDTVYVLSGSTHANATSDYYNRLITALKKKGSTVLFDADGEAFKNAVGATPDFIKPNNEELSGYCQMPSMTQQQMYIACKKFVQEGIELVTLSMGKLGAAFISKDEAYFAPALDVEVSSTVGAGDSMVAAVACAKQLGYSIKETAILAMACSAGAVTTIGTNPPSPQLVEELKKQVVLETIKI